MTVTAPQYAGTNPNCGGSYGGAYIHGTVYGSDDVQQGIEELYMKFHRQPDDFCDIQLLYRKLLL